jgi:hypothetical protein
MAIELSGKPGKPVMSISPVEVTAPSAALADGPGFVLAPAPAGAPRIQIEAGS